ncbi:MAG: LysR family transcriptional regulator [Lysobacterales bacterium]
MKNWNEIRTAACVARLGTVTAAAQDLSVHRATVIRHIDLLEQEYGAKLFVRAQHGYTATDFGKELLAVADLTSSRFEQLHRYVKKSSKDLQGQLVVAAFDMLVPKLLPVLARFSTEYPTMNVLLNTGPGIARLDHGEADIAFRVGKKPDHPDLIVRPFQRESMGLFASKSYLNRMGMPTDVKAMSDHVFVSTSDPRALRAASFRWMDRSIPGQCIRYRFGEMINAERAIAAGLGIGFLPHSSAQENPDLIQVMSPLRNWSINSWRVTHVDLHRSGKIKAFLDIVKSAYQ